ncbi:MAG: MarR family transcriptional regulator [Xanthobacteraceae bacterium]|nr:MarR family transcriptional regulator [Xanthobacteraceae bacterium]
MSEPPLTTYLVRRAQILITRNLADCLRDYNLTPAQYLMLSLSRRGGELSSASLARRFTISPQSMNEMIAGLERKKLIARTVAGEKRRTLQINLTPEGARLLKACDRAVERMEQRMFSPLSAAELHSFRSALMKMTGSPSTRGQAARSPASSRGRRLRGRNPAPPAS